MAWLFSLLLLQLKNKQSFSDIEDLLGLGDKMVLKLRNKYDNRIKYDEFVTYC
jgi:hypothetical protein